MTENTNGEQPQSAYTQAPSSPYAQQAPVQITNQVIMVNHKSTAVSYVLWFFLGQLGIHKFYLGKTLMGLVYLGLGIIGWATTFILVGWFLLAILWILMILDLFTIPGAVRKINERGTSVRTV